MSLTRRKGISLRGPWIGRPVKRRSDSVPFRSRGGPIDSHIAPINNVRSGDSIGGVTLDQTAAKSRCVAFCPNTVGLPINGPLRETPSRR